MIRKLAALAALVMATAVHAQVYPLKVIAVIVPFPAGSASDQMARMVAQKMPELLGQPFVVENKPEAASNIGTAIAAKAPADGYTLLFTSPAFAANPALYPNLPWRSIKSFPPVIFVGATPNVIAVKANAPYKSLADFIAQAKARPGRLNYASSGVGTSPHLLTELLKQAAGIDLLNIPYKSSAEAFNALLVGDVAMAPLGLVNAVPRLESKELRALTISSLKRSRVLPAVPTVAESGFPRLRREHLAGDLPCRPARRAPWWTS